MTIPGKLQEGVSGAHGRERETGREEESPRDRERERQREAGRRARETPGDIPKSELQPEFSTRTPVAPFMPQ